MEKKWLPVLPEALSETQPSPTLVKTAVGKGMSERVFLPVAEAKPHRIRPDVERAFIHGFGAEGTVQVDGSDTQFRYIGKF